MLNKVKTALRIKHSLLDSEITDCIASARAEMVRAGVNTDKANDDEDALTVTAVKAYCMGQLESDPKRAEGYQRAFESILENLRKSEGYRTEEGE